MADLRLKKKMEDYFWTADDDFFETPAGHDHVSPRKRKSPTPPSHNVLSQEQHFLALFTIGMFFGPDLKGDNRKTPAMRKLLQKQSYTSDQLAGSQLKLIELEHVYYHVVRNAAKSVVMNQSVLGDFFQGTLKVCGNGISAQLPDLFDRELHPRSYPGSQHEVIKNIVYINNPDTSFIPGVDMKRFKELTGLENMLLDFNVIYEFSAPSYPEFDLTSPFQNLMESRPENDYVVPEPQSPYYGSTCFNIGSSRRGSYPLSPSFSATATPNVIRVPEMDLQEEGDEWIDNISESEELTRETARVVHEPPTVGERSNFAAIPNVIPEPEMEQEEMNEGTGDMAESEVTRERSMAVYEPPTVREWSNFTAAASPPNGIEIHYKGSIANHPIGPQLGLMDIGDSPDAYYFRVALPGVGRNNTDFFCHVEPDGKVVMRGISVTGQSYVHKHGQIFALRTRNLPPPGPFTVTFNLPGPVDPDEFSFDFGDCGLLEGYVLKKDPEH